MIRLASIARTAVALAGLIAFAPGASAAEPALDGREIRGTVGAATVGGYFVIRDGAQVARSHYFYTSRLKDIPLSGEVDGENVMLREPEGGVFHLHLFSNGSAGGQPLTFHNSVGLVGTWTRGSETLPVTLTFDWGGPVQDRFYAAVTEEPDAAFEARVARFLHAVATGDRRTAAGFVHFPLRVNAARSVDVRNRADLLARWDSTFTPRYVALLRTAVPHEMFVHEGEAMVANGAAWFDAMGAVALNVPH